MAVENCSADEAEIRKLDKAWSDAASKGIGNLDNMVSVYAPNATVVWPDQPPAHGPKAIRKVWKSAFEQFHELHVTFGPVRIGISEAGDMASDFGKVSMAWTETKKVKGRTVKQRVKAKAKYLMVWTKVDGAWKVLYDSYNMNAPES
jgi:ketosteroid isomerase-like protein